MLSSIRRLFICSVHQYRKIESGSSVRSINVTIRKYSMEKTIKSTKRIVKRKKKFDDEIVKNGFWRAVAYSTAEEYDLEELTNKFKKENMFEITSLGKELTNSNFIHAKITQPLRDKEVQEFFIFKEGAVVTWNVPDLDIEVLLSILSKHQTGSYSEEIVRDEGEIMNYTYNCNDSQTKIVDDDILLSPCDENRFDKYAVSNAMASSVKLGIWEAVLTRYIDSMADITDDLKCGNRIKMSQSQVMRKTGELFALRHVINLSSDLLDTPDLYWDREELEKVYQQTTAYFCINKRTKVINEKINHCIELVELLSSHLRDHHHVRLEWMIIILIMVEVAFEALRHIEDHSITPEPSTTK